MNKSIKQFVLSNRLIYESYFFLTGKKLNRKKTDRKIDAYFRTEHKEECIENLIVSVTSFGQRIYDLKYTLFSLLQQTVHPEKIVVWLAEDEFSDSTLPHELLPFKRYGVEFEYCQDIKQYKKLIPAIWKYPGKHIVTADDDIFYSRVWLEKLWECHLQYPLDKITHRAHRVTFNDCNLNSYSVWPKNVRTTSGVLFPTGGAGTLYPAHTLYKDTDNKCLYETLCPKADDVWFFFMGYLSRQKVRIAPHAERRLRYVDIYKEYGMNNKVSLRTDNVFNNLNDVQIRAVMDHYQITDSDLMDYK
ncbi:MAG: glycosyltransferase family 2 protein [Bacteroidaceae bacterium]|nr:glycosyltransferase family 2 protein [Bacteroidaceae bacterium]